MTPRTGRPPSDDPRDNQTRIRMSDAELEKLNYCAEVTGRSKAEIVREGIDRIYQELKEQEQVN